MAARISLKRKSVIFGTLNKASYIELFFDLVFVFCMRSIVPVAVDGEEGLVGWYSYYTFVFTYAVMLQVWFKTTTLMNRFGTGGVLDILCLIVNMFLLLGMTNAISTGWEQYYIYNLSWVLINVNLIVHWCLRFYLSKDRTPELALFLKRVIVVLTVQALLVLMSFLFSSGVAQLICLAALVVGFLTWRNSRGENLNETHCEHLVERCALLVVLAFGEIIIGIGHVSTEGYSKFDSALLLAFALGMFLVYLNQIQKVLDTRKLGNGFRYIAIAAWLTFCIGNITAGFEAVSNDIDFWFLSSENFFAMWTSIFLLSFFLLLPFAKECGRIRKRWIIARTVACLGAVLVIFVLNGTDLSAMLYVPSSSEMIHTLDAVLFYIAMSIGVLSVYLVLYIDWKAFREIEQ